MHLKNHGISRDPKIKDTLYFTPKEVEFLRINLSNFIDDESEEMAISSLGNIPIKSIRRDPDTVEYTFELKDAKSERCEINL